MTRYELALHKVWLDVSNAAGGAQSVPKASFGGGCLIGCSGGFLNVPRIKGTHMAMKTGILAAEAAFAEISVSEGSKEPLHMNDYQRQLDMSWVKFELEAVRISAKRRGARFECATDGSVTAARATGKSQFHAWCHANLADAETGI